MDIQWWKRLIVVFIGLTIALRLADHSATYLTHLSLIWLTIGAAVPEVHHNRH